MKINEGYQFRYQDLKDLIDAIQNYLMIEGLYIEISNSYANIIINYRIFQIMKSQNSK